MPDENKVEQISIDNSELSQLRDSVKFDMEENGDDSQMNKKKLIDKLTFMVNR